MTPDELRAAVAKLPRYITVIQSADGYVEGEPPPPPPIIHSAVLYDDLKPLLDALACPEEPPEAEPEGMAEQEAAGPQTWPTAGQVTSLDALVANFEPPARVEVDERAVRDVLCRRKDSFTERVLMEAFDLSRMQARELVTDYEERGIIRHVAGRAANAQFEYVPPTGGPTRKPRGEQRVTPTAIVPRGDTIAHTGKPMGPSGKPGRDKKNAELGRTIKRARQGT